MREALIFGATGQIGQALLQHLLPEGWRVHAVSRQLPQQSDVHHGVHWLRGELGAPPALPARVDAIFSCGPLDLFSHWYAAAAIDAGCVVAFGSTSASTKQASLDPRERDLARRLLEAEQRVLDRAAQIGASAVILRPTLVYGAGRDASLTKIAAMGSRFGFFPLPRGATGLRQPVHVGDLAAAAWACVDRPGIAGKVYALPGGETLAYREMVKRVLGCLRPPVRLVELPSPLFKLALSLLRASGRAGGFGAAGVARMGEDLVFDAGPAQADLEYRPRMFDPVPGMFDRA